MIVGLVGKIGSGKSTAAQVFIDAGFKRIAFADYMKRTLAEELDIPLEWFYTEEGKQLSVDESLEVIAFGLYANLHEWLLDVQADTGVDVTPALTELEARFEYYDSNSGIETFRELLQYAGTELLRACDPDFHIKVTLAEIAKTPDVNYVMDDVRFPNEMEAIKKAGGTLIKLLRNWDTPSTHSSETAMEAVPNTDFGWVIWNSESTKEEFLQIIKEIYVDLLASTEPTQTNHWFDSVTDAMEAQRERYGESNAELDIDDPYLLAITTEQLGKAADMLNYLRLHSTSETYEADLEHLRNALVGVMASTAMWLEKFE